MDEKEYGFAGDKSRQFHIALYSTTLEEIKPIQEKSTNQSRTIYMAAKSTNQSRTIYVAAKLGQEMACQDKKGQEKMCFTEKEKTER